MTYQYKTFVVNKMNMPFTIIFAKRKFDDIDSNIYQEIVSEIERYLDRIEKKFSIYKEDSFVSKHNNLSNNFDEIFLDSEYQEVYVRVQQAKTLTSGYFNPFFNDNYNPTGFVKGWAIENAFFNYLKPLLDSNVVEGAGINGAGDMQVGVREGSDFFWQVGIENPHDNNKILAKYSLKNGAIATSGLNKKGAHIVSNNEIDNIQVTVVGEYLSEVDVFATTGVSMPNSAWEQFVSENKLTGILMTKENKLISYEGGKLNEIKRS